jgi:DNA-binding CsgD family transcriptional regulator
MIRPLFLGLFHLLISTSAFSQQSPLQYTPFIHNYEAETYKAGIQNWDITQGEDGRLYVANNLGLLVHDGSKWENYQIKYGTKLRSLLVDGHQIYVGSQNDFGYFSPQQGGQLVYTSLADSLPADDRAFDETWTIYKNNHTIYFCTFNSIFSYENGQLSTVETDYPLEISYYLEHELIVQEWGKGLSQLEEDELHLLPSTEFFKDKRVSSILPYSKSQWLITTFNDGLFLYEKGNIKTKTIAGLPEELIINHAVILANGQLAIGTQTQGLYIIDEVTRFIKHLDTSDGLMDNTINSLYEDSHGSLWLSLNNGLSRVDLSSPLTILDDRSGVDGAGYAALEVNGKIYLGTNIGAYVIENGVVSFIQGSEGQVYSIQAFQNGVYLGHHRGLMSVMNKKANLISDEKGAWKMIPLPNDNKHVILGTYNGLSKFNLNTREVTDKIDGFVESSRMMAFEGEDLWVTQGYKGAFKIKFDTELKSVIQQELYDAEDGFPSNFLINVFEIDGQLIFTAERGFYEYNPQIDRFQPQEQFNTLIGADAAIVDMDEDALGNIYFIERDEIGFLTPSVTGSYDLNSNSFGMAKSQWNDDLGNITAINNNEVLIGARKGFIHYDRRKDDLKLNPLSVAFDEIRLLGTKDSIFYSGHGPIQDQEIIFDYTHNSVRFNFYAPDFKSGNETSYQYYLQNFQDDWSDWSNTSFKEFTNLKEGKYTFHIKAKNLFNQESEITTFAFEIKPPIYRTTGAFIFYGTGTIFLFFLGFKTLDYRHKEETKALELAKNTEIEAKDEKIKEIAETKEKEIDNLKSEKLEAELKLKSQDLTSSAMHLIQKNELLTQVKQTLKGLDKEKLEDEAKNKLRILVKNIDKDLASGEEWAQFETNFDQVHGNFITRLKEAYPKLTPQEIKFSAYIRMNLNTKEIANLLNISVRGVEIGRYRVRKKLELERKDNLSDFLLRF